MCVQWLRVWGRNEITDVRQNQLLKVHHRTASQSALLFPSRLGIHLLNRAAAAAPPILHPCCLLWSTPVRQMPHPVLSPHLNQSKSMFHACASDWWNINISRSSASRESGKCGFQLPASTIIEGNWDRLLWRVNLLYPIHHGSFIPAHITLQGNEISDEAMGWIFFLNLNRASFMKAGTTIQCLVNSVPVIE